MKKIRSILRLIGIDTRQLYFFTTGIVPFFTDYIHLKKQLKGNKDFPFGRMYPVLHEKGESSGVMKGHYFHQDLYIAQRIFQSNPKRHIDIGSRIDGFVAHVATFRAIEVIDIRKNTSKTSNIIFTQADLMNINDNMNEITDSISSLHAVEHFGLGRYGDPINQSGHLEAINNIHKMLRRGGIFYFSVPFGPQRIEFNAHRVFSLRYLLDIISDKFEITRFSFVDDKGDLYIKQNLTSSEIDRNFGVNFGCAIFELIKK